MPILALVMILNNYSYQQQVKLLSVSEYDPRAQAIHKAMAARHFQKASEEKVIPLAVCEDESF